MKRPVLVTVLAVVHFVCASLFLAFGTTELNDRRLGVGRREMFDTEMAVLALLLVGPVFACGVGLWNVKPYGRRLQIVFAALGLVAFPVGTVVAGLILFYMWTPGIRMRFSREPAEDGSRGDIATVGSGRPTSDSIILAGTAIIVATVLILTIYLLASPYQTRSKAAANEATAIASMRSILSAQVAYAAAGGGGYATSLVKLGIPCPGASKGFIAADLSDEWSLKSGYIFRLESVGAPAGPADCNGGPTETDFYATADPENSEAGTRGFSASAAGTVYEAPGRPPTTSATFDRTATPVK